MPVSRNYGGYTGYHSSYQPPASVYATSYTSYGRSGGSGSNYRSGTPGPGQEEGTTASVSALRSAPGYGGSTSMYGLLSGGSGSGYKYLTRDWGREAADAAEGEAIKTIKTEELDVDAVDRNVERRHAIPGAIKRDTAADLGDRGKQVVRMVTARQKNGASGSDDKELTLGQRLALKHLLVDPKKEGGGEGSGPPPPKPIVRRSSLAHMRTPRVAKLIEEEEEQQQVQQQKQQQQRQQQQKLKDKGADDSSDEWTWETCSSSEEGPDVKYFPPTPPSVRKKYGGATANTASSSFSSSYSRAKTTDLSSALSRLDREDGGGSTKTNESSSSNRAVPKDVDGSNASRQSLDRWSRAIFTEKKDKEKQQQKQTTPTPSLSSEKSKPMGKPPLSPSPKSTSKPTAIKTAEQPPPPGERKSVTVVEPTKSPKATARLSIPTAEPRAPSPPKSFSAHSEEDSSDATPAFARTFKCPGLAQFSSDEDSTEGGGAAKTYSRGWRKGQPPRSDVVVKITSNKADGEKAPPRRAKPQETPVINSSHSRTMNRLLTSSQDLSSSAVPAESVKEQVAKEDIVAQEEEKPPARAVTRMPIQIEDRSEQVASVRKVKEEVSKMPNEAPVTKVNQVIKKIVENILVPVPEDAGKSLGQKIDSQAKDFKPEIKDFKPEIKGLADSDNPQPEESELKIVEQREKTPPTKPRKKKHSSVVQVLNVVEDVEGEEGPVIQAKMEFSVLRETPPSSPTEGTATTVAQALDDVIAEVVATEKRLDAALAREVQATKKEEKAEDIIVATSHEAEETTERKNEAGTSDMSHKNKAGQTYEESLNEQLQEEAQQPKQELEQQNLLLQQQQQQQNLQHKKQERQQNLQTEQQQIAPKQQQQRNIPLEQQQKQLNLLEQQQQDLLLEQQQQPKNLQQGKQQRNCQQLHATSVFTEKSLLDKSDRGVNAERKEKIATADSGKLQVDADKDGQVANTEEVLSDEVSPSPKTAPKTTGQVEKGNAERTDIKTETADSAKPQVEVRRAEQVATRTESIPNDDSLSPKDAVNTSVTVEKVSVQKAEKVEKPQPPKKKVKKVKADAKKKEQQQQQQQQQHVKGNKKKAAAARSEQQQQKKPQLKEMAAVDEKSAEGVGEKRHSEKSNSNDTSSTTSANPETPLSPAQLQRLPSPMRKFFEAKSKAAAGEEVGPPEPPKVKPKYWDNVPSEDPLSVNPMAQMAKMRDEAKKHREAMRGEQEAILRTSGAVDPEEPWYEEESVEMQEQLKGYEQRPSNHGKPESERRTPEENMAIVRLYGGSMFPEGDPGDTKTPRRLLIGANKGAKRRRANGVAAACGSNCHRKCEKLMANLCGINQQMLSDTLHQLRKERSQTAMAQRQGSTEGSTDTKSSTPERSLVSPSSSSSRMGAKEGNINEEEEEDDDLDEDSEEDEEETQGPKRKEAAAATAPPPPSAAAVRNRPKFRKYGVEDFSFLKVLGKGSFGKVLLAELRSTRCYYAVKCLKKDVVLEDDDIECTMIERKVLALGCKHPFLCHLFCTFQTNSHLFFVMEYLNGGDLMFHIQQTGRFEADRARFYAAEILLALRFLHRKGIVYRDLKLDNLLLDYEGHIRIADFGMCKLQIYLDKTADTFCGTPDYMAPEIIKGLKYTYCVDWWSFGVLLYEMLIGQSPFNGCDEDELFWSICNEQPYFPRFLSREAKHILQLLLEKDPSKRLGVPGCAAGDVCEQPFFRSVDFAKLEKKDVIPPYKPKLRHALDVSYFDEAFTQEVAKLTPVNEDFLASVNQMQFKGFSYTNPNYTTK